MLASASVLGGEDAMNGPDVEGMLGEGKKNKGGPAMLCCTAEDKDLAAQEKREVKCEPKLSLADVSTNGGPNCSADLLSRDQQTAIMTKWSLHCEMRSTL